jgi:hypothetical protein
MYGKDAVPPGSGIDEASADQASRLTAVDPSGRRSARALLLDGEGDLTVQMRVGAGLAGERVEDAKRDLPEAEGVPRDWLGLGER